MKARILYLCYFSLREPLVQTQVLPYLRQIVSDNLKVEILTFEPNLKEAWSEEQIQDEKNNLLAQGIIWHFLPYHKSPSVPATIYDVFNGARYIIKLSKEERIDVFHARAHVAAMMGAMAKKAIGGKLLFDIRGFIPEEYTDAGIWKENGIVFKAVKRAEKTLLKISDAFVVLTERAREILFPESFNTGFDKFGRSVEVIPCCVDLERFKSASDCLEKEIARRFNLENRFVITYVGSFGGWYMTDEMLRFLSFVRQQKPETFALILTQRETEKVEAQLIEQGFRKSDFFVGSVAPADIPSYLNASDIAISFIKACYSKQASSPTKVAEYLASGLPVISNSGVGDLDALIEGENVGVILDGFSEKDFGRALQKIEQLLGCPDLKNRCRKTAAEKFDLEKVGGERYRRLYEKILPALVNEKSGGKLV